jgi:hypothetical protein
MEPRARFCIENGEKMKGGGPVFAGIGGKENPKKTKKTTKKPKKNTHCVYRRCSAATPGKTAWLTQTKHGAHFSHNKQGAKINTKGRKTIKYHFTLA